VKWLGLGAGEEGELKKLEQTTINKRIFIKIEVCVRDRKAMISGCVAVEEALYVYVCVLVCQFV